MSPSTQAGQTALEAVAAHSLQADAARRAPAASAEAARVAGLAPNDRERLLAERCAPAYMLVFLGWSAAGPLQQACLVLPQLVLHGGSAVPSCLPLHPQLLQSPRSCHAAHVQAYRPAML